MTSGSEGADGGLAPEPVAGSSLPALAVELGVDGSLLAYSGFS
jgi:hypothetical protein